MSHCGWDAMFANLCNVKLLGTLVNGWQFLWPGMWGRLETPSHRCSKRMHQTIWASVRALVVPHRFMASFPLWSCHTFWKGVHSVAKMPKLACRHFPWTGREGWMHCDDLLFCDIHIPSKSPKQLWVFLYHFISWSKWSHLYKLNQHSIKMAKFWCSILVQSCKSCL